jgi:ABC-type branched-subunit amino acid transport system substrate-binding protein
MLIKTKITLGVGIALVSLIAVGVMYKVKPEWLGGGTSVYRIGVLIPETGNLAFIGKPMRNALTLAEEESRKQLAAVGIDLQLTFADSQGNPREAVTQFNRLADIENVRAIVTTLSGVIGAINPLARERDILLVGLTPDPTFLKTNSNALRVLFSFDKEGNLIADIAKQRKWKKLLLLHSTDAATTYEVSKVLLPRLSGDGVEAVVDTFTVGQRDFKTLCAKHASSVWDAVIYHGFGSEIPFVAEACGAFENIAKAPKIGPLSTLDVKPDLRKSLVGMQFYAPAFMAKPSGEYDAFAKRYAGRFPGQTFTYSSVYAYDAYQLIANALLARGVGTAMQIKTQLGKPTKALTQEYVFNASGDFQPESSLNSKLIEVFFV